MVLRCQPDGRTKLEGIRPAKRITATQPIHVHERLIQDWNLEPRTSVNLEIAKYFVVLRRGHVIFAKSSSQRCMEFRQRPWPTDSHGDRFF